MNHSTRLLAYGFIVILMMMISLAIISIYYSKNASSSVNLAVIQQLEKINLINELSTTVHNRTQFTQSMLIESDSLSNPQTGSEFSRFTNAYVETRHRLLPLLIPREKEAMLTIDRLDQDIAHLNKQVSILLANGNRSEAGNVLLQQVLPETTSLLAHLSDLSQSQRLEVQGVLLTTGKNAEENQTQLIVYAVFSVFVSLAVAILAVWYSQKLSTQLQEMNSYLEEKVDERTESLLDMQKGLLEDNTELTRLALTDSLTGLSNRAHMSDILQKEYSRYVRHDHRFGIIMVDIDHFKKINDSYGHDMGDQVLIQLSRTFEQATRNSDFISRWGGEEFLICCTTINEDDLLPIAENIRKLVFNSDFGAVGEITISLGCALIQVDEKINELIKRADVALYAAKNNGRNQTVVSEFTNIL
jgi:diguanylate cyclase (GGDEF)-like protein